MQWQVTRTDVFGYRTDKVFVFLCRLITDASFIKNIASECMRSLNKSAVALPITFLRDKIKFKIAWLKKNKFREKKNWISYVHKTLRTFCFLRKVYTGFVANLIFFFFQQMQSLKYTVNCNYTSETTINGMEISLYHFLFATLRNINRRWKKTKTSVRIF